MLYLRLFNRFNLISLALSGLSITHANAVTLNVSGGELLGAFDVDVDGTHYDVEFLSTSPSNRFFRDLG